MLTSCKQVNISSEVVGANTPNNLKLKCPKEDIIASKEEGDEIKYLYNSKVEVTKDKDEAIEMRTKNAKFFKKSDTEIVARIYGGEPFYKQGEKWYQTETATTTKTEFDKQTKLSWIDKLLGKEAIADTIYSGAGDGQVSSTNADWDTCHDATSGSADYTFHSGTSASKYQVGSYRVHRLFLPFDTSSIASDATILSTTLNLYVSSQGYYGSNLFSLVQTDQPDNTVLGINDFNNCGSVNNPTEGSDSRTSITSTGWKSWTLNATGLGWTKKNGEAPSCGATNGWTCLGIRDGVSDCDDVACVDSSQESSADFLLSEEDGTASDPYLEITYTVPSTAPDTDFMQIE